MNRRFLMGSEVEYSMAAAVNSARVRRGNYHGLLLDAMRAEHAWLPDMRTPSGIYIDNGSRYYLDAGNHNEFSSPEVATPREIAVYDRANERNLMRAKEVVKEKNPDVDICITKNNVNFSMPDRAAWGQHEAYMCWISLTSAATQLIPHLVSRIPYAGAGCLSSHAKGFGYETSQRSRHMTRLTGRETTRDRAIFCTRAWKSSDVSDEGWTRTNLICKDSQRCSFGMYLTYGVTSLLLMIMNQGHKIGRDVQLKDAVKAMRAFSLDPLLKSKVLLANGKKATALDIQRAYLEEARPHVESGNYPDWTAELFAHWSQTLDQLADNPLKLADRLDTYLKMTIFDRQLRREGMTWKQLKDALVALEKMRAQAPEPVIRAVLSGDAKRLDADHRTIYDLVVKMKEVRRQPVEHLCFAVRLQALELNYHELGSLFDQLLAIGQIDSVVVTEDEVQQAMHNPPDSSRAKQRGASIRELTGQSGWYCDWQYAVNEEQQKWIDLRDPFADSCQVTPLSIDLGRRRRPVGIDDIVARIVE